MPETTTPNTPSARAITALALGLLSLIPCCMFFAGLPAVLIGQGELRAIADGAAPEAGQGLARTGFICGLIGSVLGLLYLLAWLLILARHYWPQ